jgi:nitroimidazol reductase NimA-like FMN-containing flavoprotein (pyridoxamine 5'-phosphate oxidase superfamily)
MAEPVTKIDTRYSSPGATAASWADTQRALESAELFWVSTVRADGRPHVTPVVAVWFDGAVWFGAGPTEQKSVNLRTNQHVVLTTGRNSWDEGLDVVVEGDAVQVTDDAVLAPVAGAFTVRWDGRWQYIARDGAFREQDGSGEVLVFRVAPTKVFAHAKGDPFGATRHRFSASTGSENA